MADVERISEDLARDLRLEGWSFWVDSTVDEPFDMWLSPPGLPGFLRIKLMSPLEMVSKLDVFNEPGERLTVDEIMVVAEAFGNKLFFNSMFGR